MFLAFFVHGSSKKINCLRGKLNWNDFLITMIINNKKTMNFFYTAVVAGALRLPYRTLINRVHRTT